MCKWCNVDPAEAAKRYEGPHAKWCPFFSQKWEDFAAMWKKSDEACRAMAREFDPLFRSPRT